MKTRAATSDDAHEIATIYNQGFEDRVATFETRMKYRRGSMAYIPSSLWRTNVKL